MNTRSLVNASMMLGIYLVLLVLYTFNILPVMITFILPIPFIIYYLREQTIKQTLWLFVGACVGSVLISSVLGLMTTLLYGLSGLIIVVGIHFKWPYWNRILNTAIVFALLFPLTFQMMFGMSYGDSMTQMISEMQLIVEQLELSSEEATTLIEQMQLMIQMILPTAYLLYGLLQAFVCDKVASILSRRMNLPYSEVVEVKSFQLGKTLAIVLIIAQILMLFVNHATLSVVFVNIVFLLNFLFVIQGIIVIVSLFSQRNKKGLGICLVTFATLFGAALYVAMFGVMDAFYNYRERLSLKS